MSTNYLPVLYPMGAKGDDKRVEAAWDDTNYYAERKYDGSRYLCRIENGEVRFVSRQKSRKTGLPVDKTENVLHLAKIFSDFPDGTIFDGEIITHDNCTSNDVTSIMGSLPEAAIKKQEERGWVKYVIFDVLYYDGKNFMEQPYNVRRAAVEKLIGGIGNFSHAERGNDSEYVFVAPVEKTNKLAFHKKILAEGGEGTILKNIHKPYIAGKKPTDTWLKVKKYATYDAVVLGYTKPTKEYTGKDPENWEYWLNTQTNEFVFESPQGKAEFWRNTGIIPVTKDYYMGWIGAVRFGQWLPYAEYDKKHRLGHVPQATQSLNFDGVMHFLVEIGQTDGLSDAWKEEFTQNGNSYLNKVIEVGGMEQLVETTGAIRHPRFLKVREDKRSRECIFGEY